MNAIFLILLVIGAYILSYRTYGYYLSRKIFKISDSNPMPSKELYDGIDYVPTKKSIVFGHHFTTIAGLGPIIGPAIGIIWGWLPALLWVVFGSIFMGAVHDYTTLIVSARNKGKTIGELAGNIINPSSRIAFQLIMQLLLLIVLSVFALIVSTLFIMYPESVLPIWLQIPIAMVLGRLIKRGKNEFVYSVIALIAMYLSVYLGVLFPIDLSHLPILHTLNMSGDQLANIIAITWCIILYIYVFIASVLPVDVLLQPRDFINAQQLFVAMLLIVAGIFVANPHITAPAINHSAFSSSSDIPRMAPLLFIIIACGAISGFHSIACSGTTVKQVQKESEATFIGFGSMLTEGFLAVLVLVCVSAGLGLGLKTDMGVLKGLDAFHYYYSSWASTQGGIGNNINSFVLGASNLFQVIGIPAKFSAPMIAVFIVSFANTSLDSATRIQRLSFQELIGEMQNNRVRTFLNNRFVATGIVVAAAAILTFLKPGGAGAKLLWPLFGSLNQLLAALGLGLVSLYLFKRKMNYKIAVLPMIFVLTMTVWAMIENLIRSFNKNEYILIVLSLIILFLTIWLIVGSVKSLISNIHF
jgi:carbon starvation protein